MKQIEKVKLNLNSNLFPVLPNVMVSVKGVSDPYDRANIITLARVTSLTSEPPTVCISVKDCRFSYPQIEESEEFVINFVDPELTSASDYCGVKSGKDHDKFTECGLTPVAMDGIASAPAILEARLSIGCRLIQTLHMAQYGIFIGEIVSVTASRDALDEKGRLSAEKLNAVAFDAIAAAYRSSGEKIASYGSSLTLERKKKARSAENVTR